MPSLTSVPRTHAEPTRARFAIAFALSGALAACGGDGTSDDTGGGAGDTPSDPVVAEDIARLNALRGVHLLADDWRGEAGDVAYLIIDAPNDLGTARARLVDVDETDNCSERERVGELRVDRLGDAPAIFLDDLFDFESGVVVARADGLSITHADVNDRDGDGNRTEFVVTTASTVAAAEGDVLPPACG